MLIRILLVAFAMVLGPAGAWLAASELLHPLVPYFPTSTIEANEFAQQRPTLALAARVGVVRGEFWTDYALALGIEADPSTSPRERIDEARTAAERAVSLAPHDARAWLLLADISQRLGDAGGTLSALRMSYYTGLNDVVLGLRRIGIVTRSNAVADDEVRGFAAHEVQTLARHPQASAAELPAIYRASPPAGRRFLEDALAQADPSLLDRIRAAR